MCYKTHIDQNTNFDNDNSRDLLENQGDMSKNFILGELKKIKLETFIQLILLQLIENCSEINLIF